MDPHEALRDLQLMQAPTDAENPGTELNKVWYLRQSPLFASLDDSAVRDAQGLFKMRTVARKTFLFDLGDSERTIFLLKRGAVRLTRLNPDGKELTVVMLGPGDLFGEELLFRPGRRSTIAVVVEDALICTSRAEELFSLLARDPVIAVNVAEMLSGRLTQASEAMEDLAYAKLSDRLVHLFERLAREHGTTTKDGVAIGLRLTHADIAALVGSTRESVSVELHALLDGGRLRLIDRRYVLPSA